MQQTLKVFVLLIIFYAQLSYASMYVKQHSDNTAGVGGAFSINENLKISAGIDFDNRGPRLVSINKMWVFLSLIIKNKVPCELIDNNKILFLFPTPIPHDE